MLSSAIEVDVRVFHYCRCVRILRYLARRLCRTRRAEGKIIQKGEVSLQQGTSRDVQHTIKYTKIHGCILRYTLQWRPANPKPEQVNGIQQGNNKRQCPRVPQTCGPKRKTEHLHPEKMSKIVQMQENMQKNKKMQSHSKNKKTNQNSKIQ